MSINEQTMVECGRLMIGLGQAALGTMLGSSWTAFTTFYHQASVEMYGDIKHQQKYTLASDSIKNLIHWQILHR